jgi:hypothetical protein
MLLYLFQNTQNLKLKLQIVLLPKTCVILTFLMLLFLIR